MRKLLVVLQTHTKGNSQSTAGERYCGAPKEEVTKRCVRSLVKSCNDASLRGLQVHIHVYDDHSSEESITTLKETLKTAVFSTSFEALESYGIMPSILACYQYGKDHGEDLVYFAQDDYLFDDDAIYKMCNFQMGTSNNLKAPVCVYPYNDPYRYAPHNIMERNVILLGEDRYWRSNFHTASCFLVPHQVLVQEWEHFEAMGKAEVGPTMEDDTINQLFITKGYPLFTPIPSLCLHMQFESEKDPFIDWKSWWNKHADPAQTYVLPKEGRILLNVGSGRGSCDSPAVKGFNEVRMDIDRSVLPNTVGTITDMSTIETGKIDALWASHIVEHLPFHDLPKAFTEIHRVLKEDGVALITVPDVQAISHLLMRGDILESVYDSDVGPILALDMLYGHRGLVERTEFMQHKTGFTKKSFEQIVAHFGFQTVAIAPTNYELRVVLSKSQLPNEQIQFIMDNFR